jgi:hypothetical protein
MGVSSNFKFLAAQDERLGALAERYFFDDAPSTLIKLRQLVEFIAKDVAAPTDNDIANGLFAETRDEFDKLKAAAPIFGGGDEGRKARAAFVDAHGHEAYFARHEIGEGSPT